jgi:hypothetical protein
VRGSLQTARLEHLDNGDLVEFECQCHYSIIVRPIVLRALRGKRFVSDDTKVLDLVLRWRCYSCGYRGPENRIRVISAGPAKIRR